MGQFFGGGGATARGAGGGPLSGAVDTGHGVTFPGATGTTTAPATTTPPAAAPAESGVAPPLPVGQGVLGSFTNQALDAN